MALIIIKSAPFPVAVKQPIQTACEAVDDAVGNGPVRIFQAQPCYHEENKTEKAAGCVPIGIEKHSGEHKQVDSC